MSIAKTKTISRLAFAPVAVCSTIMTCSLFYDFGSTIAAAIILCIVGLGFEAGKIFMLLKWSNARLLKRTSSIKMTLAVYVLIAIISAFASMAFGVNEIKRLEIRQAGNAAISESIKMQIDSHEQKIRAGRDNDSQKKIILGQIEMLQAQIPKLTYGVSERTINISREIDALTRRLNNIASHDETTDIKKLESLKKEYADAASVGIINADKFKVISDAMGVNSTTLMVSFLFVITILIELIMAISAATAMPDGDRKPLSKKKKESYQYHFKDIA